MDIKVYHTVKDKGNPDYVEANAPFKCTSDTAWMGHGYYLWDSDDLLAHWWGKRYQNDKYMICECDAKIDETCWDLHGNGNHLNEFRLICDELIDNGITTKEKMLVAHVIEFFKKKRTFTYKAIRALSVFPNGLRTNIEELNETIFFHPQNNAYMLMHPAIQICLINKNSLSLQNIRIIHPTEYTNEYFS